jgi:hypothetical protein
MQPRIYVDFNTMMMDEEERVHIGVEGAAYDEWELLESLQPGALVTLYDEELEVEAIVELVASSTGQKVWLGKPDWSTCHDIPRTALSATE